MFVSTADLHKAVREFTADVTPLVASKTTREESYYPAVRNLLVSVLKDLGLPAEVRTSTSERRAGGDDRGSVGFPADVRPAEAERRTLFDMEGGDAALPSANLNENFWRAVSREWSLRGGLEGEEARGFVRQLFRVCLATCHAPQYEEEHRESIAQDWAHVPIPRELTLFEQLADAGGLIATLLNPLADPRAALENILGDYARHLAVLDSADGNPVREDDLVISVPHFGAAHGGWRRREFAGTEVTPHGVGHATGDLYINDRVFFRNVPEEVWRYELGGYPVLKKWLGYRDARRRNNWPLSLPEKDHFRSMVQRISALLSLRYRLNELYEASAADAWTVEFGAVTTSPAD